MIGSNISHYTILEKLGGGGMGVVYKAQDTKLDRFVALKFLHPHPGQTEEEKKRFIHEARAASALDHTNICTIHEIDETDDGQLFIAMACYEGESLKRKIERGPLPIEQAVDFARQVAEGLAKAHDKNIIHRDLKPANILVTGDGVVKIIDFGLAKLAGRTQLTRSGTTVGTVAYMSPEQTQGREVDHRTDIWAFGVILYEMVTGKNPFPGDYEQSVMYSIVNEEPEPMTGLRTGVPMELERVVKKALAKNSKERYQHVDEILVDLKSVGKQLEPGTPRQSHAKAKPYARRRRFLYTAIVIAVLLASGAGVYFQLLREEKRDEDTDSGSSEETGFSSKWQNSIAVLPFKNISPDPEQEYFCDGMTEQIITNLSQLRSLKVIARTSVMKFKKTDKSIPEIATTLGVAHILEGSIRKTGNRIRVTAQLIQADEGYHLWAKDYDRELQDIFAVQDDVSEAIAGALLKELTVTELEELGTKGTTNAEAYESYMTGEYFHLKRFWATYKMEDFRKSESMFKKAIELDPDYALAYAGLADLYNSYSYLDKNDKEYFTLQQHYSEKAFQLDPNSAEVNLVKSSVHQKTGETNKAYEHLRRALELNPSGSLMNFTMGYFLRTCGLHYQADRYYVKAIELDPVVGKNYRNRAATYFRLGDLDQAVMYFKKALDFESDDVITLEALATSFVMLKKYDEAEEQLTRCAAINPVHQGIAYGRSLLHAARGNKDEALRSLDQAGRTDRRSRIIVYSLLGLKDEAAKLIDEKPFADSGNIDGSDYLDMLNDPLFENIRDTREFQVALRKAKVIYEKNLKQYGEAFL